MRLGIFLVFWGYEKGVIYSRPISQNIIMPMKFSQVDGMVKLNIPYTFVVIATNCDGIMTSSDRKIRI